METAEISTGAVRAIIDFTKTKPVDVSVNDFVWDATEWNVGVTAPALHKRITAFKLRVTKACFLKVWVYGNTALTFDYTNKYTTAFSTCVMNGRREGRVNTLSGTLLITANGSTTARQLATITNYVSPGYTVYFPLNIRNLQEGAVGYITTNGNIYILWSNNSSEYYYFTATWITP